MKVVHRPLRIVLSFWFPFCCAYCTTWWRTPPKKKKWWQNRSGIIHTGMEGLARVYLLITDSSVNNFCWWDWITWLYIHTIARVHRAQHPWERGIHQGRAWSLPSRFSLAMLLFPYLSFSLITSPSAPLSQKCLSSGSIPTATSPVPSWEPKPARGGERNLQTSAAPSFRRRSQQPWADCSAGRGKGSDSANSRSISASAQDSGERSELWLKGLIFCNTISLPPSLPSHRLLPRCMQTVVTFFQPHNCKKSMEFSAIKRQISKGVPQHISLLLKKIRGDKMNHFIWAPFQRPTSEKKLIKCLF